MMRHSNAAAVRAPARTDWWRETPRQPLDRDFAREALRAAREEIEAQRLNLVLLCGIVRELADRRVPPRTCDEGAERRVLGWLLSERCTSADFADLDVRDFASRAHRWMFAVGLELVEAAARGEIGDAAAIWADRGTIVHAAWICQPEIAGAVEAAVWRLPYPTALPQREIDLVAALGRAWSVVDDAFNVDPFTSEAA
jgi:hypothetical protein